MASISMYTNHHGPNPTGLTSALIPFYPVQKIRLHLDNISKPEYLATNKTVVQHQTRHYTHQPTTNCLQGKISHGRPSASSCTVCHPNLQRCHVVRLNISQRLYRQRRRLGTAMACVSTGLQIQPAHFHPRISEPLVHAFPRLPALLRSWHRSHVIRPGDVVLWSW